MEAKIDVGMYVRFKKGKVTYVRKLLEVIHNFETFNVYRTDKEYFDYEEKDYFDIVYPDEIIGEPSLDILDLIELGDYVNGKEVLQIDETYSDATYTNKYKYLWLKSHQKAIKKDDIKSIVTKEQFSQMEYKIEG